MGEAGTGASAAIYLGANSAEPSEGGCGEGDGGLDGGDERGGGGFRTGVTGAGGDGGAGGSEPAGLDGTGAVAPAGRAAVRRERRAFRLDAFLPLEAGLGPDRRDRRSPLRRSSPAGLAFPGRGRDLRLAPVFKARPGEGGGRPALRVPPPATGPVSPGEKPTFAGTGGGLGLRSRSGAKVTVNMISATRPTALIARS